MVMPLRSAVFALSAILVWHATPALADDSDCRTSAVLDFIDRDFDIKARRYLHSDIGIVDILGAHRNRFEGRDDTHRVERLYCHATALMSDGRKREMWYLVERNWGFAGMGQSTEYCVSGLDPWHVYGRFCRSLR